MRWRASSLWSLRCCGDWYSPHRFTHHGKGGRALGGVYFQSWKEGDCEKLEESTMLCLEI